MPADEPVRGYLAQIHQLVDAQQELDAANRAVQQSFAALQATWGALPQAYARFLKPPLAVEDLPSVVSGRAAARTAEHRRDWHGYRCRSQPLTTTTTSRNRGRTA